MVSILIAEHEPWHIPLGVPQEYLINNPDKMHRIHDNYAFMGDSWRFAEHFNKLVNLVKN